MLTTGEQRELRQIEEGLRDTDRGFAWRLALLQGLMRRAAQGRQSCLFVLAVSVVAPLLWLVAAAGRLLMTFAEGAALTGPWALIALDDTGWAGWDPGRASRHSVSPARDGPRPDETGLR